MDTIRYLPDVTTLRLNNEGCVGCGSCESVCPHGVFKIDHRKAKIIDMDGCMECGACALNCPTSVISVHPGVGCAAYIIKTWLRGSRFASGNQPCC